MQFPQSLPLTPLPHPVFEEKGITASLLRLDELHPVVSGNKLFKLNGYLQQFADGGYKQLITFGGAYSNHLAATAYACHNMGIACIGMVRGEEPTHWSPTLQQCRNWGMELQFVNRSIYAELTHIHSHPYVEADSLVIPEGGFGTAGARGAALITQYIPAHTTHCITAMGTATTLAGLIIGLDAAIQKIGVPVLKGITDWPERLHLLCGATVTANYFIADGYHFGGYAKKNEQLIQWLNTCFAQWQVPLDWVYTAKMMYALLDMAQHNFFAAGSHIVALHTGGLQGNASLPAGTLTFG